MDRDEKRDVDGEAGKDNGSNLMQFRMKGNKTDLEGKMRSDWRIPP